MTLYMLFIKIYHILTNNISFKIKKNICIFMCSASLLKVSKEVLNTSFKKNQLFSLNSLIIGNFN